MQTNVSEKSAVGEVQLSYAKSKEVTYPKIRHSKDIETFIREVFPVELINYKEYVYAIYLDRAHNIIGYYMISSGGISASIVDPRIVFQAALLCNSSALVLFHNHPSSNLTPSNADRMITKKIQNAGRLLDIDLLDHLIITEEDYYSFADNGAL